jgi:hypothetical protein
LSPLRQKTYRAPKKNRRAFFVGEFGFGSAFLQKSYFLRNFFLLAHELPLNDLRISKRQQHNAQLGELS